MDRISFLPTHSKRRYCRSDLNTGDMAFHPHAVEPAPWLCTDRAFRSSRDAARNTTLLTCGNKDLSGGGCPFSPNSVGTLKGLLLGFCCWGVLRRYCCGALHSVSPEGGRVHLHTEVRSTHIIDNSVHQSIMPTSAAGNTCCCCCCSVSEHPA